MNPKYAKPPEKRPPLVAMVTTTDAMLEKYPVVTPERLAEIEQSADLKRMGKHLK